MTDATHASTSPEGDVAAIRAVIARQFASLSWGPGRPAAWHVFAEDFLPGAPLYASARPASAQSVSEFVARMQRLSETDLRTLAETLLGAEIRVFGSIAVAAAACGMRENGGEATRTVEMLLLVKTDGAWKIAAQAWDKESAAARIPANLLGG